jgi:hypothetical protein
MVAMRTLLLGLAYLLVFTTPLALGITLWVYGFILFTDHSLASLSMQVFLQENLNFLRVWMYSWFWNAALDFVWSYPAAIVVTLKLLINTWLGFHLLAIAREMPRPGKRRS